MTAENMYNLAKDGLLGRQLSFEGYCVSAAIDACFASRNVPIAVYAANHEAVAAGEIGHEGRATDKFYDMLGSYVFEDSSPEDFMSVPYNFTSLDDLRTDLAELRGKATILLDVEDGQHSVGLKPVGDNLDEWQIVGTRQIIAVAMHNRPLDIQGIITPETITTEQVWQYLQVNNSPEVEQQSAVIFPPEPS